MEEAKSNPPRPVLDSSPPPPLQIAIRFFFVFLGVGEKVTFHFFSISSIPVLIHGRNFFSGK